MRGSSGVWKGLLALGLLFGGLVAAADRPGTGEDAGKTVVYRDTWGVPHIYAPSVEAGLFAMGWAQAQDRPEEILKNMLRGMGELASVEGPGALEGDRLALMWNLYEGSRALADRIRPEVRRHIRAFARGIDAYYAGHPQDLPPWWRNRRVDEFMVIAFSRLFLQSRSFEDGFRDLQRAGINPGRKLAPGASNQFAVAPWRSTEGAAILLGDTHLAWDGAYRFWEFRIHAGNLQGCGFTLPGIPYIGLGHNGNVAWTMTTGGPDTTDVYELKLKRGDPPSYLYDGGWRELKKREYRVRVRGGGERTIVFLDSHHGPLAVIRAGKGYAIRSSYADAVQVNEAWYEFNFAADIRGVQRGLALRQLFPHNAMAADTSGNIYYQRSGRVPKRPAGVDGAKPVDGSTSRTEWLGLYPPDDLLHLINPPQGYMQNCNVPPDAMMEGSPFSLAGTPPGLYADAGQQEAFGKSTREGWTNSRGARAVELLKADPRITVETAMAIANDISPYGALHWVDLLVQADGRFGSAGMANPQDHETGIREMKSWSGELASGSRAALKYAYWRMQLLRDFGDARMRRIAEKVDCLRAPLGEARKPLPLRDEELRQVARSFAGAMDRLRSDFGTLDKTYGDVFRVGRGDRSWPCEGGMAIHLGLTTLRTVGFAPERPDHTRWARSGQTSTTIVQLVRPIRSWTLVPLGQSDRPGSPHFRDQAEKVFSPRRMKPTWWSPGELAAHIESRTVIENPRQEEWGRPAGAPARGDPF